MNQLYPIPKRQRKIGAFPTADALRAEKAAALAASVTPDPSLMITPSVTTPGKSVPEAPKKKSG